VQKVWALISDFNRMPQWSPQCRLMKALGPVRAGTRTLNVNRRNFLFWPTTSTVTEVIPEKKLAFRVNANNTIWSYELEPTEQGTRVVESRRAENGVKAVSNFTVNALFGGVPNFERELIDGMNTSLARIKAAAES
jgi:Polyketide cyclase / dehydrase and lipid transport